MIPPASFYGFGDPARLIAFLPVIAGVVEYGTLEAPASRHFLTKAFTIWGSYYRPIQESVPTDIRLDHDLLSFLYEVSDTAKGFKALSSITSGSPPITATISGAFSTATVFVERAACRPSKI